VDDPRGNLTNCYPENFHKLENPVRGTARGLSSSPRLPLNELLPPSQNKCNFRTKNAKQLKM
jgi:hypothetical protein